MDAFFVSNKVNFIASEKKCQLKFLKRKPGIERYNYQMRKIGWNIQASVNWYPLWEIQKLIKSEGGKMPPPFMLLETCWILSFQSFKVVLFDCSSIKKLGK